MRLKAVSEFWRLLGICSNETPELLEISDIDFGAITPSGQKKNPGFGSCFHLEVEQIQSRSIVRVLLVCAGKRVTKVKVEVVPSAVEG